MKKFLLIIIAVMLFVFTGCTRETIEYKTAVVTASAYDNFSLIPATVFTQNAQQLDLKIQITDTTIQTQLTTVCKLLNSQDITGIVVCLANTSDAQQIINTAKQVNKPVIFYGAVPSEQSLASYDKCWYVGTQPQLKGEMLGQMIFDSYDKNIFADKNADLLLQLAIVNGSSTDATITSTQALQRLENNGIFVEKIATIDQNNTYNSVLELIDSGINIELFICTDAFVAAEVQRALAARQVYTPYTIANVETETESGATTAAIPTPASYGIFATDFSTDTYTQITNGDLHGTVVADSSLYAQVLLQIAKNVTEFQNPTDNIEHPVNDKKTVYLPYAEITNLTISSFSWLQKN